MKVLIVHVHNQKPADMRGFFVVPEEEGVTILSRLHDYRKLENTVKCK